jgi:hypothetical protein
MSREHDVKTRLAADATLLTILTGRIHADGALGRLGITRDTAPDAFDANGWLLPCALVRERALIPAGDIRDLEAQVASTSQMVEVWLYEDAGFANIEAASNRIYALLQGYPFSGAYPAEWTFSTPVLRDEGTLSGASVQRIDYRIVDIRRAT